MNTIQTVKTEKMAELKKNSKKGFTLVELVVVIAILAILAAIAIPVVSSTIASSQRSGALSDAQTLELAIKEAHAQIVAGDKSVYTTTLSGTDVDDVVATKALQSIKVGTDRTIGGTTYALAWCEADSKCYWIEESKVSATAATVADTDNLDTNITPGGTVVELTGATTIDALF